MNNPERDRRLQVLTENLLWKDLKALLAECVDDLTRQAMTANTDEEAEGLLHRARAAQDFSFIFTQAVERTAQPAEDAGE